MACQRGSYTGDLHFILRVKTAITGLIHFHGCGHTVVASIIFVVNCEQIAVGLMLWVYDRDDELSVLGNTVLILT